MQACRQSAQTSSLHTDDMHSQNMIDSHQRPQCYGTHLLKPCLSTFLQRHSAPEACQRRRYQRACRQPADACTREPARSSATK